MRLYKGVAVAGLSMLMGLSAQTWARDTWYIGATSYESTINNNTIHDRERVQNCAPVVGCSSSIERRDYRGRFDTDRHPAINVGFVNRDGWRTEFEYREGDFGIKSPESKEDFIESRRVMASFWRDFEFSDSAFGYYVGMGLGVGQLRQGPADDEFLMAQAGTGLTYAVTRNLTLDLGYRVYAGEPDIVLEDDNRALDMDYRGNSFNFGVRYYLY
ncbi:outer membrane protein [Litorivivens sp.]|uniref:outer membrane protein n=1 Tax=Litorivivens sp. TaxID=2020868 RepID=UPI003568160D